MMDADRDIKDYEKEWTEKVEKDSENLFNLALEVTENYPKTKVVIMKRLPRFDSKSHDPTSIKNKLSTFANNVYDQLYFKHGSPKNIKIATLKLGSESQYLRKIVMGNPDSKSYDGIHLCGPEASRHFTYRAVQVIKSVITNNYVNGEKGRKFVRPASHGNCPQARYQRQYNQNNGKRNKSAGQTGQYVYNVPTKNSFNILGN